MSIQIPQRRAIEIFEGALERARGARASFLDSACGDDERLRHIVEALLADDETADDPVITGKGRPRAKSTIVVGGSIGPYRIEREIARGGMSAVYQGVRADEEFEHRVAIKLLLPGQTSGALLRRFRSERQILARLEHPHIARLYEGGTTEEGQPYLVMEYVDGVAIDRYCTKRRLSVRRRIELFEKVCSAVHAAHQNLIVHRDIKPSNILIAADGEPRLLDFGIAKILDPAFAGPPGRTSTGEHPMTLQYASPEQILGWPITTASDVYSLGVLLYELLTGRLPHHLSRVAPLRVVHVLTKEEPRRPSAVAPPELRRRLRGDLDDIVLMALSKETARRYGSAEQLAEDLRRHLTGQAVIARGQTVGYRLRVFLRRNRLPVGGAAAALALLVAFAVTVAWQAAETTRQRDRAELERDKAKQVSVFLVDLFQGVDPNRATDRDVTVREALDRGALKIEQELTEQPEVRATLLDAIGTVYFQLGYYDKAAPFLEKALAIRREIGADELQVAESLVHLAQLHRQRDARDESEALYLEALAIRERLLAPNDPDVALCLQDLCVLYRRDGRYQEAEEAGRRALLILEDSGGEDDRRVAGVLSSLAGIAARQGDYATAVRLLERSIRIHDLVTEADDVTTAISLANLGSVYKLQGELQKARPLLERALGIYEGTLPDDHLWVAHVCLVLADCFEEENQGTEAEAYLRRAVGIYESALGERHPTFANGIYELGQFLFRQGRLAESEPLIEHSLAIREGTFDPGHPEIAESLRAVADLRRAQGRFDEVESHYRRALTIWESHPNNEYTVGVPQAFADFLRETGRLQEAAELLARAGGGSQEP